MLGIMYFNVKTKAVLVHIDSSMYIFPEVAIDVKQVLQKKLFSTCGVKNLEKYLWRYNWRANVDFFYR